MPTETQSTVQTLDVRKGIVKGRLRWKSLVSLLLLAATVAEFLTGSTPVRNILFPPGLALLTGLYGGGALLIREAALRWGKRWGAILFLGGAYAVGEEGFAAKTMIDPTGSNIGNQLYTYWAGINWVPLAWLTLFHAAFSIVVPLVLVELLFPETKGKRLVGSLGLMITAVVYVVTVALISLSEPFMPSFPVILFLSVYSLAFIIAGYYVPRSFLQPKGERQDRSELKFVLLGIFFMTGFFLIVLFGRLLPWPIQALLFLPLSLFTGKYLVDHSGRAGNSIVKIDFLLGIVLVFVPLDIINELAGDVGVLFYTTFVIALVVWIRRRILLVSTADAVAGLAT